MILRIQKDKSHPFRNMATAGIVMGLTGIFLHIVLIFTLAGMPKVVFYEPVSQQGKKT